MHWHCAIVVICSTGYSPRQSLQDTNGSSTKSQVGRYLAVVIAEQSEKQHKSKDGPSLPYFDTHYASAAENITVSCCLFAIWGKKNYKQQWLSSQHQHLQRAIHHLPDRTCE